MIPIADENKSGFIPFINYLLLFANLAIYFLVQPAGEAQTMAFYNRFGLIPRQLLLNPLELQGYASLFTSMFLHGSLLHLLGNMLYLWIFGDNIEHTLGHIRYLFFYLTVGIGAALGQIIIDPYSEIPMIGASGAISGILGAYLLKYPMNRVSILFFFFFIIRVIRVPAIIVLSMWFLFQVYNGYFHLNTGLTGGVAWFAHIGGFISGFVLIKFFEIKRKKRKYF